MVSDGTGHQQTECDRGREKILPGRYGDGGGLWLQVSQFGTKAWIFRFMLGGRARQMGLGDVNTLSLKEARERAREARQLVADGIDPIEARNEKKAITKADDAKRVSFKEATERYIKAHQPGWKNDKHSEQWRNTLSTYAWPIVGTMPVDKIETGHVMQILEPIWSEKTETASRVRGRVRGGTGLGQGPAFPEWRQSGSVARPLGQAAARALESAEGQTSCSHALCGAPKLYAPRSGDGEHFSQIP